MSKYFHIPGPIIGKIRYISRKEAEKIWPSIDDKITSAPSYCFDESIKFKSLQDITNELIGKKTNNE